MNKILFSIILMVQSSFSMNYYDSVQQQTIKEILEVKIEEEEFDLARSYVVLEVARKKRLQEVYLDMLLDGLRDVSHEIRTQALKSYILMLSDNNLKTVLKLLHYYKQKHKKHRRNCESCKI